VCTAHRSGYAHGVRLGCIGRRKIVIDTKLQAPERVFVSLLEFLVRRLVLVARHAGRLYPALPRGLSRS
jgi:hypothetical protein